MKAVHEHEFEARRGLPEALPRGERLLWQGSPDAVGVARDVLHLRKLALYFAVLLAWRLGTAVADGASWAAASLGTLPLAALALTGWATLALLALLMARTSVYTITNRRLVMRVGIVLTVTFNLPFSRIESVALRTRGRVGDIALTLSAGEQIAYLNLWPHARPWQLKRTQPMLRALPGARVVAQLLSNALVDATPNQVLQASNDARHAPAAVHGTALAA